MLAPMWKATLRGLVARRLRLALTLAAIILGVAFVTSTYVLTDTLSAVVDHLFVNASSGVDVTVRSSSAFGDNAGLTADRARLPAAVLGAVRNVPGVADADGFVLGYATLIGRHGKPVRPRAGPGIGLSWPSNARLGPLRLRSGRAPTAAGEVVLDVSSARDAHVKIGDAVRIVSTGPAQTFQVVGTMTFGDSESAGPTLASFDLATAQALFDAPGLYDALNVAAQPGVSADVLRERIAAVLPPGVEAVDAAVAAQQDARTLQNGLAFFEALVLVFAGVGVLVGAFIIFNTFGVLVAQRVRELGLLRALGATPAQVRRSVLAEAALLGLVGGAGGLAAGVALAAGLLHLLQAIGVGVPSGSLHVLGRTVVVALAVGIVVTVGASLLPAVRAARVSPIEALADAPARAAWRVQRRDAIGGALVMIGGAAFLARAVVGHAAYPLVFLGIGALLLLIGIVWLAPVLTRPVAGGLGRSLPPVSGVAGALARENALRNPRRSATTASTLMVGVSLMTLIAIAGASARGSIGGAIKSGLRAQLVLSGPELFPFSPGARDAVAANPFVATAAAVRLGNANVNGGGARVAGLDPTAFGNVADLGLTSGSLVALQPGTVLVHEGVAHDHHWHVGDTVNISFARTGPEVLRVAGIYRRNQLVFASYIVPLDVFEAGFGTQQDSFVYVRLRDGVNPDVGRAAVKQAVAPFPTVEVHDRSGFTGTLDRQVQRALGVIWALLALAVLTGVLGIVNTLALSVFERTREIGLLRTVGMARRQVWAMIAGEAVLLALAGALLGLALGAVFAWATSRVLADDGLDVFAVPWLELVAFFVLAGVAGVVASVLPAWRAAHLDVLDAIAHE
jgi:putative ABC transport system permease protein